MESERIVRDDFPTSRKGWDPDAVRAHLNAVAEEVATLSEPRSMSEAAIVGVRGVIEAAEREAAALTARVAAETEEAASEAREEAERMLTEARAEAESSSSEARAEAAASLDEAKMARSEARAEADSLLAAAREEAEAILTAAREESDRMVSSARAEGEEVVSSARLEAGQRIEEVESAVADVVSQARELGDRVGRFGQELEHGLGEGPATASAPASEADSIPGVARPASSTQATPPMPSEPVLAAEAGNEEARFVAVRMALEGHSRESISERLESEFGPVSGLEPLLDGILERFGR